MVSLALRLRLKLKLPGLALLLKLAGFWRRKFN